MITDTGPRLETLTTRLPTGLKQRAQVRSVEEGHETLSAAVVGLLERYADGQISVPVAGTPEPDAQRLEVGRQIVVTGRPILNVAREFGMTWPTARRCARDYERWLRTSPHGKAEAARLRSEGFLP